MAIYEYGNSLLSRRSSERRVPSPLRSYAPGNLGSPNARRSDRLAIDGAVRAQSADDLEASQGA
jgi:hypothetical protein